MSAPLGLVKCVWFIPNNCASRFILSVNFEISPSICSANTSVAALLEFKAACFNNCSIVYVCPFFKGKVVKLGNCDIFWYLSDILTLSFKRISLWLMSSYITSIVINFVVDAGSTFLSLWYLYNICPFVVVTTVPLGFKSSSSCSFELLVISTGVIAYILFVRKLQ